MRQVRKKRRRGTYNEPKDQKYVQQEDRGANHDGVMPEVGTVLEIGDDVFGEPLSLTVVSEDLCLTPLLTVTTETIDNYDF